MRRARGTHDRFLNTKKDEHDGGSNGGRTEAGKGEQSSDCLWVPLNLHLHQAWVSLLSQAAAVQILNEHHSSKSLMGQGLSVAVDGLSLCKADIKPWLFSKKKGSKSLDVDGGRSTSSGSSPALRHQVRRQSH
ncbi:hypothetical protein ZWY2020_003552 [Hordeum vulgare]|nr:hypothetical protein ZWY2020_003552 [Hordeum vulgare]